MASGVCAKGVNPRAAARSDSAVGGFFVTFNVMRRLADADDIRLLADGISGITALIKGRRPTRQASLLIAQAQCSWLAW
jgi:hypothetical protein